MPRIVRRRKPVAKRARKSKPRRRMMRRMRGVAERASCKEIYTINNMVSNAPFSDLEQNLGDYTRATAIAKNYQFFRIKYIKYKFIARYNTFQATTAEAQAFPIPLFHYMIDKGGALPTTTTLANLKQEGAVPIRFTKDIVVTWKPGVSYVTENNIAAAQYGTAYRISPWLMTNRQVEQANWAPNDTDHKGIYWYMETAALPGDGTYEYDAEVEVFFEFKKPLSATAPGATAIKAKNWQHQQVLLNKTPEQNVTVPVLAS